MYIKIHFLYTTWDETYQYSQELNAGLYTQGELAR